VANLIRTFKQQFDAQTFRSSLGLLGRLALVWGLLEDLEACSAHRAPLLAPALLLLLGAQLRFAFVPRRLQVFLSNRGGALQHQFFSVVVGGGHHLGSQSLHSLRRVELVPRVVRLAVLVQVRVI
jgi:hypothetical protein